MNLKEPAGKYEMCGAAKVDDRVEDFEQGKKVLTELVLDGDRVLLTVQAIPLKYGLGRAKTSVVTFFDSGSSCSIVRNKFA